MVRYLKATKKKETDEEKKGSRMYNNNEVFGTWIDIFHNFFPLLFFFTCSVWWAFKNTKTYCLPLCFSLAHFPFVIVGVHHFSVPKKFMTTMNNWLIAVFKHCICSAAFCYCCCHCSFCNYADCCWSVMVIALLSMWSVDETILWDQDGKRK